MQSQLLYGEVFKIIEERAKWTRIVTAFDGLEAWVESNQFQKITEENYHSIDSASPRLSADLIEFVSQEEQLLPIPLGAVLNGIHIMQHSHSGSIAAGEKEKTSLIETAFLYLNAPFLWGGKSPFGIDASGFTQMVYKLNGYKLFRNAAQQAQQGESLSFIEESEPGDLAFFDNAEGVIDHVGIMMHDNYIIHAYGKVRLDRIDHSGIYNSDLKRHTHQLRVIKKIV